jgi:hypothetical protein
VKWVELMTNGEYSMKDLNKVIKKVQDELYSSVISYWAEKASQRYMEDDKSLDDDNNKWEIIRIINNKGLWHTIPIMKYLHEFLAEYFRHCPINCQLTLFGGYSIEDVRKKWRRFIENEINLLSENKEINKALIVTLASQNPEVRYELERSLILLLHERYRQMPYFPDMYFDEILNPSNQVKEFLVNLVRSRQQPSVKELLEHIESKFGLKYRWIFVDAIKTLTNAPDLTSQERGYFRSMIESGSLADVLRGQEEKEEQVGSTIDALLRQSQQYRSSKAFNEMIDFMGRFRDYAPYNNMLVRLQNPSCSFYATEKDWGERFGRWLKEDARPMLILAPMHPVLLVYDVDQTEGKDLPEELTNFATFKGKWNPKWLSLLIDNSKKYGIRVDFKTLSSTHGGFATIALGTGDWKMRIVVHDGLDDSSRFGVLCHELAHIFLGHLGTDHDHWWPSRTNLDRTSIEVEAEAVAFIVTTHLGLVGSSVAYVSRYLKSEAVPETISLDMIAKVSGKIERMARETLSAPRPRKPR